MARLRPRLLVGGVVALGAGAAVSASAVSSALSAADDLERAQALLSAVRERGADPVAAEDGLRRAQVLVRSADDELGSWPVDVLAALPVVGRSFDAERAVTDTADEVVDGALVLAGGLRDLRASAGGIDLAALASTRSDVAGPARRGRAALDRLRATSTALTPPQVSDGVASASQALGPAVEALERAEAGLGVAGGLLGGSGRRTVMVALQNNAELRGAGGYVSTFATGRLEQGRFALDPLLDVTAVADPPARATRVPAPPEYTEDYGPLSGNTTIFRSWNMSPHVPDSALVGARVVDEIVDVAPDVVIMLDVPAMGAIAALGGEAVVLPDGTSVSPDDLARALLVDAYAEAGADLDGQNERRAQLRAAATAALDRLLGGQLPATDVLRTLTRLAQGRHVHVWSGRADEQETLVDLGVAGAVEAPVGGDLVHVSLNNIGGNKLDVYADRRLDVDVQLRRGQAEVVQRLSLTNGAPDDLLPYVEGVDVPGALVNRVEFSLPLGATQIAMTLDGVRRPEQPSVGQARQRLAVRAQTPRGATSVVELRYVLPLRGGEYRLRLIPQPLVEDATLSLSVQAVEGAGTTEDELAEPAAPFSRTRELRIRLPR